MTRDVQLIRAARACTEFSMRYDGVGMNIFRRRTPARAASLTPRPLASFFVCFYFLVMRYGNNLKTLACFNEVAWQAYASTRLRSVVNSFQF